MLGIKARLLHSSQHPNLLASVRQACIFRQLAFDRQADLSAALISQMIMIVRLVNRAKALKEIIIMEIIASQRCALTAGLPALQSVLLGRFLSPQVEGLWVGLLCLLRHSD